MKRVFVYSMFGWFIWSMHLNLLVGRYWWALADIVMMWLYAVWAAEIAAKGPVAVKVRHPDDYTLWQMWKSIRSDRMLLRAVEMLPEGSTDRRVLSKMMLPYMKQSLDRLERGVTK